MNEPVSLLFSISLFGVLVSAVLYVVFGQITVRKLRKNPETRDKLGVEFVSGMDILNVAQALSIPKLIRKRFEKSSLYFLEANFEVLKKHTTRFDRAFARVFYWCLMGSTSLLMLFAIYDSFK